MGKNSDSNKGVFSAVVDANRRVGRRFERLTLVFSEAGAEAFAEAKPGQFAELDLADAKLPSAEKIPDDLKDSASRKILLRRPFSFADVRIEKEQTNVDILYCAVGPATLRMTTLAKGDLVSVIGPLGNGFSLPAHKKKTAILVIGGTGAGPIIHLAKQIKINSPNIDVIVFAGAATKEKLPFEKLLDESSKQSDFSLFEFADCGVKTKIATDDGSAGYHGFVTDCLSKWLDESAAADENKPAAKDAIIYGCGPELMLAQVAKIAQEKNIDCQVSMERMMACGFGVCQSCAVECKVDGSGETIYKLCCKDGPVFDGKEVVF